MTLLPARTVSVSVDRPTEAVYRYLADPHHLPEWAPSFARSVQREDTGWVVQTAAGGFGIKFAPHNRFGVVDHRVTSDDGLDAVNSMRVIANGAGSEVLFTLFRPEAADDATFERDIALVESDLQTLRRVLEAGLPR